MENKSAIEPKLRPLIKEVKAKLRRQMERDRVDPSKELRSLSEIFDEKYRWQVWDALVDAYQSLPDEHKRASLQLIIETDIVLFQDYLGLNSVAVGEFLKKKSFRVIDRFKSSKGYADMLESEDFRAYQLNSLALNDSYEKTLNLIHVTEFYIMSRIRKRKSKHLKSPVVPTWDFTSCMKSFMLKSLSFSMKASSTVLDAAFSNPSLSKNLLSLALVAYLGFSPSFLTATQNTSIYAIVLPLGSKLVNWMGIFDYIGEYLTYKDTVNYVGSLNAGAEKTQELVEQFRVMFASAIQKYLAATEDSTENDDLLIQSIESGLNAYGADFTKLEKYISEQTNLSGALREDKNGWLTFEEDLKTELEEITSSYSGKPK